MSYSTDMTRIYIHVCHGCTAKYHVGRLEGLGVAAVAGCFGKFAAAHGHRDSTRRTIKLLGSKKVFADVKGTVLRISHSSLVDVSPCFHGAIDA